MRFLFLLFFRGHIMLVQMACQSAQVQCAQTIVLCPHSADPANNSCLQVFVLKLKSFTITVTVSQAGRQDKIRKDKMEFSAKRLRKYYKNMSQDSLFLLDSVLLVCKILESCPFLPDCQIFWCKVFSSHPIYPTCSIILVSGLEFLLYPFLELK